MTFYAIVVFLVLFIFAAIADRQEEAEEEQADLEYERDVAMGIIDPPRRP